MLSYKNFMQEVKDSILEFLPGEYQNCEVELTEKFDGNTKRDGVVIRNPEENITPVLYLDNFYKEMYENNLSLEQVMREMAMTYQQAKNKGIDFPIQQLSDKELLLDRLYTQAVNFEKNQELLKAVPYLQINDLAIIPRIKISEVCSMKVTDELCRYYGWDGDTILAKALQNNIRTTQPFFDSMDHVIMRMLEDQSVTDTNMLEELESLREDSSSMYVLGNKGNLYGASLIANKQLLDAIGKALEQDFYIIPSSIHELLIIPQSKSPGVIALKEMVMEVNRTQLEPEEFLSDNVYFYDGKNQEVQMYTGALEKEYVQAKQEQKKIVQR